MTFRQEVSTAAAWGLAQKWGHHGLRLLVFVLLARLLGPESFGLVALASVFILLGELAVDQGFSDALVQRRRIGRAHVDSAFWATVAGGVVLAAACMAAAAPLAHAFGQPRLAPVLLALAPSLVLAALSRTQEALLRRRLAFREVAWVTVISAAAGGLAGVAMALLGYGVWSLVGQFLVQRLVQLPGFWLVSDWRPRARFSPRHFRQLLGFGVHVIGINLLNFSNRQSDHLLVGYVLGPAALGFYTLGQRLLRILLDLLPQALAPVAFSAFARLQAEPQRLREGLYEATRVLSLAAFPAFTGLAVLAPWIVPAVFGEQWRPSVPVIQVLAPIGMLQSVALLYASVLKAIGRPGLALALVALNAAANLAVFTVAVHWGIVAVAAAYCVRGFLLWPVSWLVLRRVLAPSPARYFGALLPAAAATAVMAIAVYALARWGLADAPPPVVAFAGVLAGAAVYGLAAAALAPQQCRAVWRLLGRGVPVPGARP